MRSSKLTINRWWGYASQFNMLDYPGVIVPVGFVDKRTDVKDEGYRPIGPKDEENYNLCMYSRV
jgi:amidase